MSLELHRILLPFARSFEIAMPFWKILIFSEYYSKYQDILKQSRTAVSGKFLYTALLALMQSIYTKNLWCYKKFWMIYVYLITETWNLSSLNWGTFQSYYLLNLIVQSYYLYLLVCYCICIYCTYYFRLDINNNEKTNEKSWTSVAETMYYALCMFRTIFELKDVNEER